MYVGNIKTDDCGRLSSYIRSLGQSSAKFRRQGRVAIGPAQPEGGACVCRFHVVAPHATTTSIDATLPVLVPSSPGLQTSLSSISAANDTVALRTRRYICYRITDRMADIARLSIHPVPSQVTSYSSSSAASVNFISIMLMRQRDRGPHPDNRGAPCSAGRLRGHHRKARRVESSD